MDFFGDSLATERRQAVIDYFNSDGSHPATPSDVNVFNDFEIDEGYFNWSPTFSGSTFGVGPSSTAEQVTGESYAGDGSQRIFVDGDPAGWRLRHLSGLGSVADTAGNLPLAANGFVGFWLKTEDPGMTVQIAIDDPHPTIELGVEQAIVADGTWHLYQWNLADAGQWEAWVGGADGAITAGTVTLDSIQFFGNGDATIYLDSVSYNPNGPLLPPVGDFNGDYLVGAEDLALLQAGYGKGDNLAGIEDGDANGDGETNGIDFLEWQRHFGAGSGAVSATSTQVPEPSTMWLLLAGLALRGYAFRN